METENQSHFPVTIWEDEDQKTRVVVWCRIGATTYIGLGEPMSEEMVEVDAEVVELPPEKPHEVDDRVQFIRTTPVPLDGVIFTDGPLDGQVGTVRVVEPHPPTALGPGHVNYGVAFDKPFPGGHTGGVTWVPTSVRPSTFWWCRSDEVQPIVN